MIQSKHVSGTSNLRCSYHKWFDNLHGIVTDGSVLSQSMFIYIDNKTNQSNNEQSYRSTETTERKIMFEIFS